MCNNFDKYKPIGFIGSGNMATAIMKGLISSKIIQPNEIFASNSRNKQLSELQRQGVNILIHNNAVAKASRTIILAVKPALITKILDEIFKESEEVRLIISVAAGVTLSVMEGLTSSPIIRVMPNTAVSIGEGCVVMACGGAASVDDLAACKIIFSSVSNVCEEVSEENINSMIGISGSGIAYMYIVCEALADAGVKMGLPRSVATRLAAQTLVGAGKMVLETSEHPMALKDAVTSPGGTTICGVAKLEELGLRHALISAAEAAKRRAVEMAGDK